MTTAMVDLSELGCEPCDGVGGMPFACEELVWWDAAADEGVIGTTTCGKGLGAEDTGWVAEECGVGVAEW
jgi:hypothetical protein